MDNHPVFDKHLMRIGTDVLKAVCKETTWTRLCIT